jgi:hypothetical protein
VLKKWVGVYDGKESQHGVEGRRVVFVPHKCDDENIKPCLIPSGSNKKVGESKREGKKKERQRERDRQNNEDRKHLLL